MYFVFQQGQIREVDEQALSRFDNPAWPYIREGRLLVLAT